MNKETEAYPLPSRYEYEREKVMRLTSEQLKTYATNYSGDEVMPDFCIMRLILDDSVPEYAGDLLVAIYEYQEELEMSQVSFKMYSMGFKHLGDSFRYVDATGLILEYDGEFNEAGYFLGNGHTGSDDIPLLSKELAGSA